jgi:hypothetical protein
MKSPQILPYLSDTPCLMEIIIQATILSASNLFYLRSTEYYFHTHSQLEFLFQPHNHAALKIFKIWPPWCKHNQRQTVHANVTKSPDKNRNCDVWNSDSGAGECASITGHDAALVGKYSYRRIGGLACLHFHSLCSPKDPENGESRHPQDVGDHLPVDPMYPRRLVSWST